MNRMISAAILFACLNASGSTLARDLDADNVEIRQKCRQAWMNSLEKNCPKGSTEQAIRKFMETRFRDVGRVTMQGGLYRLVFLVDDFHQILFTFEADDSTLYLPPEIEPRSQWLRTPKGEVIFILTPKESASRAKAEELAIQYVVANKKRQRETLKILGSTHLIDGTWDTIVTIDTDQVDPPYFRVVVTDDGQVTEWKPGRKRQLDEKSLPSS